MVALPSFTGDDTNLETLFYPEGKSFQGDRTSQLISNQAAQLDALDKQLSSPMPNILATAAALTGNFGPAFQLQEQKLKTAIGKAIFPSVAKIKELQVNNQWEEAQALADSTYARIGARAPEYEKLFQSISQQNADRMKSYKQLSDYTDYLGTVGYSNKDHPGYQQWQALKKAVKERSTFAENMLSNIAASTKLHTQLVGGSVFQASETTGATSFKPAPAVMNQSDVETITGKEIQGHYGINGAQLTDVLNNTKPIEIGGVLEQPNSPMFQQIQRDYALRQQEESRYKIAPLVPIEPALTTQHLASGADPRMVGQRQLGPGMQESLEADYLRKKELARAPILASIESDPTKALSAGMTFIDLRSPGEGFGREMPASTFADVYASQGGIMPMRKEVVDKIWKPAVLAKQGLAYLPVLFQELGNPDGTLKALSQEMNMKLSSLMGRGVAPGMKTATVAKLIIKRAIEHAERTETVDEDDVGVLKRMITGEYINPQESIDAANMLINRINDRLRLEVPNSVISNDMISPYNPNPTRQQQEDIKKFGLGKAQKGYQEHLKQQRQQKYQGVR
jgi:hypothetical protein